MYLKLVFAFLCLSFAQYTYAQKRLDTIPFKKDSLTARRSIQLDEVKIKMRRNYKQDSLALRKEYAKVFNHRAPGWESLFTSKNRVAKSPYPSNSTSSIAGLNLFAVVALLRKNKSPISKLQKRLLKEEEYHFVDQSFSAGKIQALTPLRGDSLVMFTEFYRPAADVARKMKDYDMMRYIKKSYDQFLIRKDTAGTRLLYLN